MPQYTIETHPSIEAVKQKYKKTVASIREWDKLNARIAVFLDRWVQKNFQSEGGNVGGWAPFKYGGRLVSQTRENKHGKRVKNKNFNAQSAETRKAIDGSAKLLQDTGMLRHSFLPFHGKTYVGIGSDLEYSDAHEFGAPESGLPQRRMLPKDDDVMADLTRIYDRWIEDKIKKAYSGTL